MPTTRVKGLLLAACLTAGVFLMGFPVFHRFNARDALHDANIDRIETRVTRLDNALHDSAVAQEAGLLDMASRVGLLSSEAEQQRELFRSAFDALVIDLNCLYANDCLLNDEILAVQREVQKALDAAPTLRTAIDALATFNADVTRLAAVLRPMLPPENLDCVVGIKLTERREVQVDDTHVRVDEMDGWVGNGFIAAPGILRTAGHVLWSRPGVKRSNFRFVYKGREVPFTVKTLAFDAQAGVPDQAVCTFDPTAYDGVYPDEYAGVPPPLAPLWLVSRRGDMDSTLCVPFVQPGRLLQHQEAECVVAVYGEPGVSGSPMFYDGKVVGIMHAGWFRAGVDAHWMFYVPSTAFLSIE